MDCHLPVRGTESSVAARGGEGARVLLTLSFMVLAKKSVQRKGQLPTNIQRERKNNA